MTRIVYLCADPGIAYGGTKGASVHVAELTAALAGEGADILLAVTRIDPDASPPPPGVELMLLAGPARTPVDVKERADAEASRAEWLADRAHEWGAAMLYERMALHAEAGGIAARAAGIPHVVELNAPLPEEAARYRRLEDPARACDAEGRVLRAADAVLAVSRPLAYYARRRGARRVDVVPNAVNPARFPLGADAERQPPTAVFAGSLRPWHGARVLADAWRLLGRD
ncbi:MAG: glycosyltransferase, partial [Acidimicrobiales bacterium]